MPIFDNELIDNVSNRGEAPKRPDLTSLATREVDVSLNPVIGGDLGANTISRKGMSIDELSGLASTPLKTPTFGSPMGVVTKGELLDNQKYPLFQRDKDLENIYGLQQNAFSQLGHSLVKAGVTAVGTFAQSLSNIPNTVSAIKNADLSKLSGDPNGYEGSIDNWIKNMEDVFPNYYTRHEKEHPYLAMIPGAAGSANFWGESVIKNLGFMGGAILGAAAQDLAIGVITEGIGELPLIAAQIGKTALYLNKLFTGTNEVEKVLDIVKDAGVAGKSLLSDEKLAQAAAYTKVTNSFRYGAGLIGSSMTEAGVEGRDGYRQVKENLLSQYKLEHPGEELTPEASKQIEDYATNAMNTRFGINMALLTVSNAVQFDNLFKSFSTAEKGVTSSLTREIGEAGKIGLKEGSLDTFEKKAVVGIKDKVWDFVKPKLTEIFTEGVYEEGGQYAAERGTYDYYTRKYKNLNDPNNKKNWDDLKEMASSTTYGLSQQFNTTEGINNMIVGGLTAVLTGGAKQFYDYKKGNGQDAQLESSVNMLNRYGLTGILSDKYDNTLNSIGIAKEMKDAAESRNIFKYKNLKHDMFFNYVQSRIPSGMHDVTIEQLNMLKDLSKEDFEKSFGMDFNSSNQKTVSSYIDSLIEKADNIKSTTDAVNNTFKNPFTYIVDPKSKEEGLEQFNHNTFENWKTDLTYYGSTKDDINDRLQSIENKVIAANPLLNNDTLSNVTDKDSLTELSRSYEEEANRLNKTITEYTTPADKKAIREQIKALRTNSEKITIALNKGSLDLKTFHSVLNFELNNQDSKKDDVVGLENATELHNLGADINKLNNLKKNAVDIFDKLATEEGFNKYFKQAEDIAKEEVPLADLAKGTADPTFVNDTKQKEKLEVGREYEIRATKKASIKKLADDRYQVTSPDGKVSFYKTRKEAVEESKDLTDENTNLGKVKILALNDDGTVKVEDMNGDILNIDPKRLRGYKRLETDQERILKNKEQIIKQQTELEHNSGIIATSNQVPAELFREGKLIDAEALFLSSTTESEGLEDATKSLQHIKNSRVFLNNIAEFPNRSNIRVILVTPKQVAGLNLNGLVQMSYGKESTDSVDSIEDVNSIDNGFVAQVFVEQNKDGLFYVNKEGETIGKVGEDLGDNLKDIIFQTMRTTSLTYRNGNPRYRSEQEAEARAYAAAWKEYRKKLFNAEATEFPTFEFFVSAGIPIEIKTADGIKEKNHVGGILIKEELISNQANLIVVPTKGTITNSRGEIQKTPNGVPVLQYGDTLQFLNNRSFNNREAEGIYETIRRLANQTVEQSNTGQAISFNKQFTKFLQNVLYWKSKADTASPNQIGIDEKTLRLNLGTKSFPLDEIDNYKKEIIDHLTDAKTFNSINTKTLTDLQSSPFEEWYINQEGNFVSSKWANYQTYLLSNKYPSGKARPIGDTPLSTSIAKPTEAVPYSFQQRYSTITQPDNFNVQVIATPAKKEEKKEEVPTPKIFEFKAGPVQYTSQEDADGNIIVEVERSATTKAVAVDTDSLEVVINALKAANKFDASIPKGEEETYVTDFMAMQIAASLKAEKLKQQAAPKVEEKKVEVSDTEAKKADIEKRRQEEIKDLWKDVNLMKSVKTAEEAQYVMETLAGTHDINDYLKVWNNSKDIAGIDLSYTQDKLLQIKDMINGLTANLIKYKYEDKINAKYDAELAALEGGEEKETPPSEFPSGDFRRVGKDGQERMTDVELTLFKEWHASNVPNIPFEVLDNIITTYDGEKAWGVFENGIAKFVRGGLRATEYHEIFEGIYKGMLSSEEQQALLSEFKNRDGFFTDRQTGKKIPFLEATDLQAKERIADDFADFRKGKLPARSLGEAIRNFFTKIMNFFKSFVNNPSLKENLFKSINEGKFKERKLAPSIITEAPEYRPVEDLTVQQANNFVQDILARASGILFRDGEKGLLFNPQGITGTEMFNKVEEMYIAEGRRQLLSDKTWGQLKERVKDKLRIQGINFNEEEVHDINNDETNKNDYVSDPFTVEGKKSATPAVKFLLSTQIERESTNQESALTLNTPPPSFSEMKIKGFPIKGYKLMDYSRTFATLLDKLSNTSSVSTFTDKLFNLAQDDANYVGVFQKISGKDKVIPFKDFKANDWRLFIDFMQTFARQKPDALIQYKSVDSVHTGAANLFTANKQTQQAWMENIKTLAKGTGTIVNFNNKVYTIDKEALQAMPLRKAPNMIEFLNAIGIEFDLDTYNKLKSYQKTGNNGFTEQVQSIYAFFGSNNNLMSISGKTLDIDGPLSKLAELYNKVNNPSQESTYFGVENQRIGAFSENNAPSIFENEFNEAATITDLKQTRTELNDIFSVNSQVLKEGGLFYDENGKQIKEFKVSYIQGEKNQDTDKGTSTSKLKIGDRYTLEINQNLNGNYYILMPADGSTEWMMNIGNNVSFDSIQSGSYKDINAIFKGYLMDDINLALDFANREKLLNVGGKGKELRFFKDILADEQLSAINKMIEDNESLDDIKKYIDTNIGAINNSVKEFINGMNTDTKNLLVENKKIIVGEKTSKYLDLDANFAKANSLNKNALTEKSVDDIINFANTNYIIANIEYHKILFGDPYQFAVKKDGSLDQTKRIKSWLSPRRTTFDSAEFNTFLNNNANKADDIKLEDYVYDAKTNTWTGDLGGHKFKSHTNTITIKDVITAGSLANINKLFGDNNEADAVSWLRDTTHREIKLKNKQWNLEGKEEEFFQWQMAFTRTNLPGYKYSNSALEAHDKALMETPMPKHKLEILKPIVTGNKFNKNNFDQVLDKFSQVPIYYSMVKGTNLEKLYIQMMKQDIGYAIVESGRKIGTQEKHSLYNGDGSFNSEAFSEESIVQVPWKAYGIQVETASSDNKSQTRGSQLTKLASMDIFDNGVASSVEAEKEYNRNKEILDLMHANGYKELLIDLGIEDLGTEYIMKDGTSISETLMREMLRREVSDNSKDTLELNEENQFIIPFEASPSYTQIRSILYSMIDKAIGSPKMTGGAHVQMPATMLESATKGRSIVMKNEKGVWEKITREKYATLTAAQKANVMLTDDTLKFYTKAEPWCEVYMPHWFKDKFKGKFKNDRELLNYLNIATEGKAILSGIGFRIPTQALSSVEVFRVKGFLPQYMGSTVVVPSEITTKAGSDFDIDKLNMYLKSIYVDSKGDIKLVKYLDSEEATKEFFGRIYDETILKDIQKIKDSDAFREELYKFLDPATVVSEIGATRQQVFYDQNEALINEIISQADDTDKSPVDYINDQIQILAGKEAKLNAKLLNDTLRNRYVKEMYKKSLENEYYDSLEKLITLEENFDRLISPIDDAGLKKLAGELDKLRQTDETSVPNRILNRNFMTPLRNSFVMGKKWVGIVAVNITNLSLKQKSQVYIDPKRFQLVSLDDQVFLGDGTIALKHNTTMVNGEEMISLSGTIVKDSTELISNRLSGYATAVVDVAKDDFITRIIQSDLVIGTFMFLENIGAGRQTAFFLNQPIISEYLKIVNANNASNLFDKKNITAVKDKFGAKVTFIKKSTINLDNLESNISDYYNDVKFDEARNAEQLKIFSEFLKYAKMAEYNFSFTQATNYDTSRFGSGDMFARKEWQTQAANDINIISSAKNILDSTFIGTQSKLMSKSMKAMSAVFNLEKDDLRIITESIMKVYGKNKYLSQDNFNKISNKAKMAFLDYIIQTKTEVSDRIYALLINPKSSVATKLERAKIRYPFIQILKELQVTPSDRIDGAKSIQLRVNDKSAESENLNQEMMRELRDYNEETKELYNDIISVAILQGSYQSAISIKNIIPIEDYSAIVAPVVASISSTESLKAFSEGFFERNNFDDPLIMPRVIPFFKEKIEPGDDPFSEYRMYTSESFPTLEGLGLNTMDRQVMIITDKYNQKAMNSNYVAVNKVTKLKDGTRVDVTTGKTITKRDYAVSLSKGDYSLNDLIGYKRVLLASGEPLRIFDDRGENLQSVYKMVNLYGDGAKASEFYTRFKPSVIDNGTLPVKREIDDRDIVNYYGGEIAKETVSLSTETFNVSEEETFDTIEEFTPERKEEILQNFADKHKMTTAQAKEYINTAIAENKEEVINKLKDCY